jgi:hypothetical protein
VKTVESQFIHVEVTRWWWWWWGGGIMRRAVSYMAYKFLAKFEDLAWVQKKRVKYIKH